MGLVILAGDHYNAAARGTLTVTPAADPLFLSPKLIDGLIDEFWSQGSIVASSDIRCDLNLLTNGGFETFVSGAFTGWTSEISGVGVAPAVETVIKKAGAQSCKLVMGVGAGYSRVARTVLARAGARMRGGVSLYGTTTVAKVEIFEERSGLYLNSSLTWQTAQAYCAQTAFGGSWEDFPLNFVCPTYAQAQSPIVSMRVRAVANVTSSTGYVDEFYLWPETNLAALIGHNVDPAVTVEWRKSTDNFAANNDLVATVTPRAGVMYSYQAAPVTARYVALLFTGTPAAKIRATEVVWGYALETMLQVNWDFDHSTELRQIRTSKSTIAAQDFADEAIRLSIDSYPDDGTFEEFRNEVFRRTEKGQTIIAIPHTTKDPIFIGRRPPSWNYHAAPAINSIDLVIEPLPRGIWTP